MLARTELLGLELGVQCRVSWCNALAPHPMNRNNALRQSQPECETNITYNDSTQKHEEINRVVKELWWEAALHRGTFSFEKFNVTLDCFCGRPIRMLVNSMWGISDVRETGNSALWHAGKSWRHPPSKVTLPVGNLDPIYYTVPWANPSPHPEWHLDRFSPFAVAGVVMWWTQTSLDEP